MHFAPPPRQPRRKASTYATPLSKTKKLLARDPGPLQTRSSRLRPRESTHDQTTHDLMRIVSSAAAKAAQAQSLHLCYARGPNQKSFSRATRLFSRSKDSMPHDSIRNEQSHASSGRARQAEEAMPGVPPQNWSQAIFARFWPSSVRNFGNFPPESIWIFRPLGCFDRHHLNFFAQFRPVVLCQYLDIQDLTLVSRECTVSGLESILVFQSQTKHCITSSFATGRFCPSPVRKFPLESIWIFRPLGCIDRHD